MTNQNQSIQSPQQKHLGALRLQCAFVLHTIPATKVWSGKALGRDDKLVTAGIPACIKILNQLEREAVKDDPFADVFLLNFEKKIEENALLLHGYSEQLLDLLTGNVPDNFEITVCENKTPVHYDLRSICPLAYKLVMMLCEFDNFVKTVSTARFIGILPHQDANDWIHAGIRLLRSCISSVIFYRPMGITSKDVLENSIRYQQATKKFNINISKEMLDNKLRHKYAVPLRTTDADLASDETQDAGQFS